MELKEIRNKSIEELNETVKDLKKQIEDSMEGIILGKDKNLRKVRAIRKDLARVLTVKNEQEKENSIVKNEEESE
ncbi:MAG: coiled-coil [candidate division WWE3 bacterium GW2011_GWC1_41_7]|uniref:Large ribosomal subunit protein uL29 n=4 Tax=Katanobacteria TaxID=422282 RepID=A0A0G0XBC7_UNCKA|nr:MAG: 50S ribosomal protein L29 [candidate division WWE3 bacterium GW2011_GWB1_41_6]KKS20471.1 MAG: coiled-coil [candidate division WWE3 bacterium GW2011_GWC1_41_7]KKS22264.1 MAG: 50S ribosomal protein L29 [candidate division WWE3 bacterium GW2011_GWA1_41_8]OGC56627.1 MAG: 50S ribosomal protein L29 [candidate division WWE3 bacterium RIFCSPLOWO2_01_FULL_41_9]